MEISGKAYPSKQCPLPSQAQLALAIAIVNSKPIHMSVVDYMQQIRSHITSFQSQTSSPTADGDKYFDSVAFWKKAYAKAEDTQSKLNDRVYELEQRIETLKLKLKEDDNVCNTPERRKRSGSREPSVLGSQRKRQKTNHGIPNLQADGGFELAYLNGIINKEGSNEAKVGSVMRHLSVLQQNIQKRPNWPVIYSSFVELCKAVISIISLLSNNSRIGSSSSGRADDSSRVPNPMVMLALIETCHTLLFRSLNKALNSTEGRKYDGQMIYHMVGLFETALGVVGKMCNIQACGNESLKSKRLRNSSKSSGEPISSDAPKLLTIEASSGEVLDTLRGVLASMMLQGTALVSVGNNGLFEGYLYVLLNRVGTVLSVIEFKEILTIPDMQASSEKLPLPQGLCRMGMDKKNEAVTGIPSIDCEIEVYHLVWLLEKAVALVHSISIKSSLFEENPTTTTPTAARKHNQNAGLLLRFTKRKLQSTLLKAVFHEEEPFFVDSLKKPQRPLADDPKIPWGKESESASEWFLREVWRLLGWDILESIWQNDQESK